MDLVSTYLLDRSLLDALCSLSDYFPLWLIFWKRLLICINMLFFQLNLIKISFFSASFLALILILMCDTSVGGIERKLQLHVRSQVRLICPNSD